MNSWLEPCKRACLALVCCAALSDLLPAAEPLQLTHDGRLKFSPTFAGTTDEIVYTLLEKPELFRLMRLRLADGSGEPINKESTKSEFEPSFSADGRYLVFMRTFGALSVGLVIRDLQTQKDVEVLPPGGFAGFRSPAVSSVTGLALYSFADVQRQRIFSVNLEGGDRKVLVDSSGISNWPAFSPDGRQIVFSSTRDGDFDIDSMGEDGSGVRRLTESRFQDIRPKFSPDGRQIAFTSSRDGNYEVYVMQADGLNVRRITNHPERDDYPTWHPDGRRLVLVSERSGRHDLYLVDVPE